MAGLLALMAFVVLRRGGCTVVPSRPPPGVPPFASGGTGVMVSCAGGPELLVLVHTILIVTVAIVLVVLALVFVQTITGRRFLPLPVRAPLRPRLFALGVAVEAAGVGLVALESLVPPMTAAGLLLISNALVGGGVVITLYARGPVAHRSGSGGLWS